MGDDKTQQHLNDINQEFKEKEVQEKAKELGLSYINLLNFRVNPDALQLLSEHESQVAKMVVFFQVGKKIRVAVSEPNNPQAQTLVQRLKTERYSVNINLASEESIKKVQELYKSHLLKKEEKKVIHIEEEDKNINTQEIVKDFEEKKERDFKNKKASEILSSIHEIALQTHASDIHFQAQEDVVHIRCRIDGMLQNISSLDTKSYDDLTKQIKMNSHLKLNINNAPQDGQYFFQVNERNIDVRVSIVPSSYGPSIVLRLLDPQKGIVPLSKLGFKKYALEKIASALSKHEGALLITGPTGAGKTTTLYSILDVLNKPYRKIITLEDPVEYKIKGIVQCEASHQEGNGMSFEEGLTGILRQDPDVIMLGEIREPRVANIAIQSALTGHLVLSTLHSNSAIDAFSRLYNLKVPDYLLNQAIHTIIGQRLIRRVCQHCISERERKKADKEFLEKTAENLKSRGIEVGKISEKEKFGKGCNQCNNTGYYGRITVVEILIISDKIRELIQKGAHESEILVQARQEGFVNIREDAAIKAIEGETTMEEVWRII